MKSSAGNIAVIGAGPIGGILTSALCSHGHSVILVDAWKEHIERIRADGLNIEGRKSLTARPAHLLTSVGEIGEFSPEFVFICTKGCDLENVLNGMGDRLKHSNAVFASFQNGIDTEQILAQHIDPARVLRAVISFAGVLLEPGRIRESFFAPPNYLGWLNPAGERVCREVAALVSAAGLETEATGEIRKYAWRKTILNTCTMAIAAVTGLNMQEMLQFPPTSRLADRLLQESIAVAAACGFDYGPDFFETVKRFNEKAGPHRPSMLVDLENGRRTENRFLVRRVAEYGEEKGVPAPLHRALADLIDGLEMKNLSKLGNRQ